MKTYLTITFTAGLRNEESQSSFIRPRSAKRPTCTGAARMVAAKLQRDGYTVKPSDISVTRMQEACYQTN